MLTSLKDKYKKFADFVDRGGSMGWIAVSAFGYVFFWPAGLFLTLSMFARGYMPVPPKKQKA